MSYFDGPCTLYAGENALPSRFFDLEDLLASWMLPAFDLEIRSMLMMMEFMAVRIAVLGYSVMKALTIVSHAFVRSAAWLLTAIYRILMALIEGLRRAIYTGSSESFAFIC